MRVGRILLGAAALVGGLLVGAVGAGWLFQRDVAWRAADRGVDLARTKLGWNVTIGDASFVGPFTLRLSDVRAVPPTGGVEVFVRQVEATVDAGSVLSGRLVPEVVTLRAPTLRVDDLAALRRSAPAGSRSEVDRTPAGVAPPRERTLPAVVVEGGALRIGGHELELDGVAIRMTPEDSGTAWALDGEASMGTGACALGGRIVPRGGARLTAAARCDTAITWPVGAANLAVRFKTLTVDASAVDGGTLEASLEEATLLRMAIGGSPEVPLLIGGGTIRTSGPGRARLDAKVVPGKGPGQLSLNGLLLREGPSAILDVKVEGLDLAETPLTMLLPFDVRAGRLAASVAVDLFGGAQRADVSGNVTLVDVSVDHPWLAATSVGGLRAAVELDAAIDFRAKTVDVFRNVWTVAGLPIEVDGHVDLSGPPKVVGSIHSGPHDGDRLSQALPPALFPKLVPLEFEGRWSADATFDIDASAPKELTLDIDLDVTKLAVARMGDIRLDKVLAKFKRVYADPDPDSDRQHSFQTGPGAPHWVALERLPPALLTGLRVQEDGGFFKHAGFSMLHVKGALRRDIQEGRLARGASTISMQTVKNVFLSLEKTLSRKLQEVVITWQMERYLDKPDILEVYVNVIEWGPHVYGVRQAARHYFDKRPEDLSPVECVYLSTMVPGPRFYHRQFAAGRLGKKHRGRIQRTMALMVRRGHLTPEELSEAEAAEFSPELAPYVPPKSAGGPTPGAAPESTQSPAGPDAPAELPQKRP